MAPLTLAFRIVLRSWSSGGIVVVAFNMPTVYTKLEEEKYIVVGC